jgi:hypothetical protein
MCDLIFSTNFEIFIILKRIQGDIITNVHRSLCKECVIILSFY